MRPGGGPGGFGMGGPPMGGPPLGPPREAMLFVPPNLTGMIIGKGGAQIKMLRQEAGGMDCAIDLQKNEGDGSANIVISGANGNDVMVPLLARPPPNPYPDDMLAAACAFWRVLGLALACP